MRAVRAVAAAILVVATTTCGGVAAKSLRQVSGPAEIPPPSYRASQYVDSTGCVFIRAGRDGAVRWVPRVTRKGQVLCGYKPTQVAGATRPASQPRRRTANFIEIKPGQDVEAALGGRQQPSTVAAAATAPRAAAQGRQPMTFAEFLFGKPRTRTRVAAPAATVSPGPSPTVFSNPVAAATPTAPSTVRRPVRGLAVRTTPQVAHPSGYRVPAQPAVGAGGARVVYATPPAADGSNNPYWRFDGRHPVRYGPQNGPAPGAFLVTGQAGGAQVRQPVRQVVVVQPRVAYQAAPTVDGANNPYWRFDGRHPVRYGPQGGWNSAGYTVQTRATDTQVAGVPATAYDVVPVPPGYRPVYPEGRLNPLRGRGTGSGEAAMNLVWTQTVPRRLVDVGTGRDVTAQFPQMVYPYTSLALQQQHLGVRASTRGTPRKKRVAAVAPPKPVAEPLAAAPLTVAEIDPGTVTDTAATAVAPVPAAASALARPYVQVATFGVPANARRTLARFQAAGLPVQSRPLRRGGRSYDVIVIGPFADVASLAEGLASARAAGFADAFATR